MGLRSLIALVSLVTVSALSVAGCSNSAQKVQPETRGKRGENCQARNDCENGLACLNGICAKNEFNIDVSAKQCDRIECSTDEDCCGDRLTEVPAKCEGRDQICDPANARIQGCVQTTCTSDDVCNGGTCPMGQCSGVGQNGDDCQTALDCPRDTCVVPAGETQGTCSLSQQPCVAGEDNLYCTYFSFTPTCTTRVCNCQNPDYDPTADICSDPDCDNICLLRCESSLCVEDQSCKTDDDCLALGLQICDGGRCVECVKDKDCNTDQDETCEKGLCHKPCTQNEECGLFEECQKGDCVYVGCQSDRECILAASRGQDVSASSNSNSAAPAPLSGSDDPRLYKCLPSESDADINVCKIPCENDGSCGVFEACDKGFCKFIGCTSDEECRAYLGIADQQTSDNKPYVPTAKCE